MDLKTHIGVKVKAARTERGLTQEELAHAIGKATETVSNIERGEALTGIETLQKISQVVGKPMAYFFESVEDERNVSRVRMEAEEKVRSLVRTLGNNDLTLAMALIETMTCQRNGK